MSSQRTRVEQLVSNLAILKRGFNEGTNKGESFGKNINSSHKKK
jgi:hypothetical protein